MCVCGGKQHFDKKPRCTLLIPPSPVGFVHHPWGNRTKPKQLTRWVGGLLCIRRTRGRQQSWCFPTCWVSKEKQFTIILSNLIQLKAIFSFSLSPNLLRAHEEGIHVFMSQSSCLLTLASVRVWVQTELENWLSCARSFWFIAWCYLSMFFNIKLSIPGNYNLRTSLGGLQLRTGLIFVGS